ncbi:MAG: DUF2207 domain-containing protein, partial [Elusimicrobium sp.]|nr:DUF2207 domain-containing protein [Elusimicrobium sp.]
MTPVHHNLIAELFAIWGVFFIPGILLVFLYPFIKFIIYPLMEPIVKYFTDEEKEPVIISPSDTMPIVSHTPPESMTPCLAAYIMNNGYTKKILSILVTHAAVKNLLRIKDSPLNGAMILETLAPSEDFEILPQVERAALFILLGEMFLPGRIFKFINNETPDFNRMNDFLSYRLEQEAYSYMRSHHAYNNLLGFKKYLEVAEFTRLPNATP